MSPHRCITDISSPQFVRDEAIARLISLYTDVIELGELHEQALVRLLLNEVRSAHSSIRSSFAAAIGALAGCAKETSLIHSSVFCE